MDQCQFQFSLKHMTHIVIHSSYHMINCYQCYYQFWKPLHWWPMTSLVYDIPWYTIKLYPINPYINPILLILDNRESKFWWNVCRIRGPHDWGGIWYPNLVLFFLVIPVITPLSLVISLISKWRLLIPIDTSLSSFQINILLTLHKIHISISIHKYHTNFQEDTLFTLHTCVYIYIYK